MPAALSKDAPLIIVGAGVFGLSLAYDLASNRGYTSITVLDRYMPPVPDGSSVDVSRIIRSEYADPFYASLAVDALAAWRTPEWADHFYESGFAMISTRGNPYMQRYRDMRSAQVKQQPLDVFEPGEAGQRMRELYPGVKTDFTGATVMKNNGGGWANAHDAIRGLAARCSLAGVSFITGTHGTVESLETVGSRITGVKTAAGTKLSADTVVLATGAWTNNLVPDIDHSIMAVGQPVGFIQLTPQEAAGMRGMPVMMDMDSGVFCFPPTPDTHQLKLARHGFGFATQVKVGSGRVISSPKVRGSNAASGYLPQDAEQALRQGARFFFPQVADRPWAKLRMCWYTDTPEGNFVVDHHPSMDGLFLATGGSGQ
ncbi:putative fructosyl amino acid oxidase [Dactylonectria macrodidyma]|uniref:Fructosyl amino acid oxidase n=1 Tax=Dactylonectria macrodidyma TaxID=307937 RepID=A0A9P9DJ12_9HYPO|nr:putative fructosyl amino acid oxidase [Dactylonectria macrodidyma]